MKVDLHKPHGLVFNHPHIRYEQDGKSFNHQGLLIGRGADESAGPEEIDAPVVPRVLEPGERDFPREQARDFLQNILKEGPLRRTEIFKTANENNQPWEKVKEAFADMEGETFNRKNSLYWKLKTE